MKSIHAVNVNDAFSLGIAMLKQQGLEQDSQHGRTLEIPEPVSVCYMAPQERVLFNEKRDINPFLHFFEPLWILAGRNDVKFLEYIVPNMAKYSDNGSIYFGAYGHRMRHAIGFNMDQIEHGIERLAEEPDGRQVVLTIREAGDLWYRGKDTPCNLMAALKVRHGRLNIHVFNRSNDFIWGLTGTNVCQFSMLQEYIADKVGVRMGTYHQTTDSFHVYKNQQWLDILASIQAKALNDPYSDLREVKPYPMGANHPEWDNDLKEFFFRFDTGHETSHYKSPFFCDVVEPMWRTFAAHKQWRASKTTANENHTRMIAAEIAAEDWYLVTRMWLERRWAK
jgi:thymidylate synthase